MLIFYFLLSEMGALVEIATVLSFITAPFYAILNYKLVTSKNMPDQHKPSKSLRILSIAGILFLSLFWRMIRGCVYNWDIVIFSFLFILVIGIFEIAFSGAVRHRMPYVLILSTLLINVPTFSSNIKNT